MEAGLDGCKHRYPKTSSIRGSASKRGFAQAGPSIGHKLGTGIKPPLC